MKNCFLNRVMFAALFVATLCFAAPSAQADVITTGDVTDFFGNNSGAAEAGDAVGLLFDEARTGDGDTAASGSFAPVRRMVGAAGSGADNNWADGLTIGTAGDVTFTGLGLTLRGGTTASGATVTITYLGGDDAFGTADDVVVGSATDDLTFSPTSEYVWNFDAPMTFAWDGLNDRFRFDITGNGGVLRMKSHSIAQSPSGQGGLKMSVGGFFVAVPEPTSMVMLTGLLGLMIARRRRA